MVKAGILLRRARAIAADEPTGFTWIYDGQLAGSGYPASKGQVAWLGKKGVSSVLSVTEEPLPSSWIPKEMSYAHILMRDHEPPDQRSLALAAARIESELSSGKVVLVHCQAGRGRTMCAIGAYLIRCKGMGASEAIAFMRSKRPNAVEQRQETSLKEFADSMSSGASGIHS